jgi:peptide/nickel transport system substrate-binding protein
MTAFSRSASLLVARTSLAVVMLSFVVFGAWTAGDLFGRPTEQKKPRVEEEEETPKAKSPPKKPRVEEEEEAPRTKAPGKKKPVEEEEETPRSKPKRKVIRVEEEEEDPKAKSAPKRSSAPAASGDLNQLAEQATHPTVKKLFRSLAVPYDLVVFKRTPRVTVNGERSPDDERVEPISLYLGNHPSRYRRERIRFTPLTHDGKRSKSSFEPILDRLELVQPYEEIAQDKVRRFFQAQFDPGDAKAPAALSRYDKLVAAEQVLSAVLRWHESARQTGKRRGEEWASVEKALRKQLLDDVLLEQMKVLAQSQDWGGVLDLAHRLATTYTDDAERKRIFRPVADMIQSALRDPTGSETTKQQARKRLLALEREFPGNPAFQPIGDTLRSQAQSLLDAAKELTSDKNDKKKLQRAQALLRQAEETWPDLPELRTFKNELNRENPILRVGVRGPLPKYFSPAWACTDNEHRAVELLFESLVKRIPDAAGGFRYCPGLTETRPKVVPLGRQFELPRNAVWSDKRALNSADISFSLESLRSGMGVGRSRVWGELLLPVESKRDAFRVTLRMRQGFLDPLALMSFKILPQHKHVNSEAFATSPVTSGPFRLDLSRHSDEANRECRFFEANPFYGLRPTKRGLPHIQEVRFYMCNNPVEELASGKLDLVLDLTAQEAQTLREKQSANRPIVVPTPSPSLPNRRIYFLALNNRKLADAKLRRALAFAINREALLNKHFRAAPNTPLHRPLNGPFPAGSWACNPDLSNKGLDLHDAVAAKNQIVGVEKPAGLTLKYPEGDPVLAEAMKELSDQVKALTGVVLEPTPCDPYQLREDVERRHNYDLAYSHYDFPDESYWLAPLLGPPPASNTNMFPPTNAEIAKLLAGTESYRDFAVVQKYQWMLHKLLHDEMPFIPLWQLDPLLAYRSDVQPAGLDWQLVFRNIEEWRLQRR